MKLVLISMVCLLGARGAPLANHHEAEAPPTVVPLEKAASANSEEAANVPSDTGASSIAPPQPSSAPAVVENAEDKPELPAEAQIPNLKSETNLESNSQQPQSSSSSPSFQEKKEEESKPVAREASLEEGKEKLLEQNAEAQVVPQTQPPQEERSGEAKKEDGSLKEAASEVKETVQVTSQEAQPQAPAEAAEKKVVSVSEYSNSENEKFEMESNLMARLTLF